MAVQVSRPVRQWLVVVPGELAVLHEPSDGAFDDPAAFDHGEAFDLWVFGDDLDVDAKCGSVFEGLFPKSASTYALVSVG
jgi:hypothetical protein